MPGVSIPGGTEPGLQAVWSHFLPSLDVVRPRVINEFYVCSVDNKLWLTMIACDTFVLTGKGHQVSLQPS